MKQERIQCPECFQKVARVGLPMHMQAKHGKRVATPARVAVKCPYCGEGAELTNGGVIYPHRPDLAEKNFYRCVPCDAYVGCHPGTITPLGRLANAELRGLKSAAHRAFDPLWKSQGMTRNESYKLMARLMEIPESEAHIGMFDVERCRRLVSILQQQRAA